MKVHPAEIMIQHMPLAKVLEMMIFAEDEPETEREPRDDEMPYSKTMPAAPARMDEARNARPLTRLIAHVPRNKVVGPGISKVLSYELRNT